MGLKPRAGARKLRVRRSKLSDVAAIYACQAAAYPMFDAAGLCDERQLAMQIRTFPEGQFVVVDGDRIVGYATSLIVTLDEESPWYSYAEITGNGTFSSHDPSGDSLYGADIAVHPDFRGRGIAGLLYGARKRLIKRLNLRRLVAGGRIPGYRAYAGRMSAETYVEKVVAGEITDMALNAHLKAGYIVRGVHMGYVRDPGSLDYATFLELPNPGYKPVRRQIAAGPLRRPVRKARVCAVQYLMRPISSWDELEHQVSFFVSTAEQYHCHFLLFPELFTAQLFSSFPPKLPALDGIKRLAALHGNYLEMFTRLAVSSGVRIIGGSTPVQTEHGVRNVAHLFTPAGHVYTQDKLHVTPNETREYGIVAGDKIRVFDTGIARIAIAICYDVEFPELARLTTLAGAEILMVPFSTDERKAYLRVRYSAQARAVENAIYVALAGNVGNLPQVDNFLINYGQSVVCTPSDFEFPTDAIAAAADTQGETVVITDLDLGALDQVREFGSVRPLRDRRPDLYRLEPVGKVELVRAD